MSSTSLTGIPVGRLTGLVAIAALVSLILLYFWTSPLTSYGHHEEMNNSIADETVEKPVLLLWVWPENYRFDLKDCKTLYNIDGCHLTDDRALYSSSDAVLVYHRGISWDLSTLPPSPRIENLFNLTLSYREDADIPVRLRLTSNKTPNEDFTIPKKDKLVCWIRNTYYNELKKYITVHMFGSAYAGRLSDEDYYPTIASCKFYLSFENSIHKDYITEKFNGPLSAGTVPVVLGPPRKNYERFAPRDAFIHVDDFPDAKSLAEYLTQLDRDEDAYRRYFNWRRHFSARPHLILQNQEFVLAICTACDHVARHKEYQEAHDIYEWFFN
ncbi:hypothetical protein IRJ41_025460 [Triplophysa rosa]|uniref:Fucosyltransferase n=1 Tax=Triplophysa rosa TaxID=992332 RepID=A0A9W7TLR5_TRIRA|nr:hypothetical protein IRJ41_025460 [Triplophysa rosa]